MLGNNLKKIRLAVDMSQTDLAAAAGITSVYVSNIENNKKNPSADILNKLAIALNVSIDEFFKDNDEIDYIDTLTDKEAIATYEAVRKNDVLRLIVAEVKDMDPEKIRQVLKMTKILKGE